MDLVKSSLSKMMLFFPCCAKLYMFIIETLENIENGKKNHLYSYHQWGTTINTL